MNATFWTAIAAIVGVIALAATFLVHVVKWAEDKGHMRARIEGLERTRDENHDATRLMAGLEATVKVLSSSVSKLDNTLNNLLQGKIELPPSRRRRVERDCDA